MFDKQKFQQFWQVDGGGSGSGDSSSSAGVGGDSGRSGGGDVSGGRESTGSVIHAAVAEAQANGTLEGDGEGKPPTKQTAVDERTAEAKARDDAEEAEIEKIRAELKAKNPKLQGKLDVDRHQAVVTRIRNQAKAEYEAAVAKHQEEVKQLEWAKDPEAVAAFEALALADRDPKKFVEMLLHDPRYKELISFKERKELAAAVAGQGGEDPMPEQDATTPDGQMKYYSHEGLEKRMAWERRQAAREAKEAIEKEYGPLKEEFQARNQWNASVGTAKKTLDIARNTWPGFKENEKAIGEAMVKDKSLSLDDAHRQVVIKQYESQRVVNEAELRKKILGELNLKPAAARSDRPGSGVERTMQPEGEKTTGDAIRASLRADGLI